MSEALAITSPEELSILEFSVGENLLTAKISDGRIVSIPIAWFPRLRKASKEQLQNFEISPANYGIHWPDVDEDISVRVFVNISLSHQGK